MLETIIGAVAPAVIGKAADAVFGGSKGSSSNNTGSGTNPLDFYAQYGAQAAAAQNPHQIVTGKQLL